MYKALLIICLLLYSPIIIASDNCFLAKENNNIIKQDGECIKRYSPASTFKIPITLMGYDFGILYDEHTPIFYPPTKGDKIFPHVCKEPHNPKTWIRDSCVWYTQEITKRLGIEKFKEYVVKFHYGNEDVNGDKNLHDGLTNSWLSSSLQISPKEQIEFLQNMLNNKLGINKRSYKMIKKIFYITELPGGWKLYGKTGLGYIQDINGDKTSLHHGWFIGWVEKNNRRITFVNHLTDTKQEESYTSLRAKNEALIKLVNIIEELEK